MTTLDIYTFVEIDTDLSRYRVKRAELQLYLNSNEDVNAILRRYRAQMDYGLYIVGNYLYFTLEGVKYWTIVSSFSGEWDYIETLMAELKKVATDVCYEKGHLD